MRKEVKDWWNQANRDLLTANNCKTSGDYYACAFFCQQAVEKALKSLYITKKRASPGRTHSLIYLATETEVPTQFHSFLRRLAPEFVTTDIRMLLTERPMNFMIERWLRKFMAVAKR